MITSVTISYENLVERIRTKCRQEHWFGSELTSPSMAITREEDPQRSGFVFPSVSEEQIQEAERSLEFPLPPFLRYLYMHIANGGFGPGMGLYGVPTSSGSDYDISFDSSIAGFYRFLMRERTIDLNEYPPEIWEATEQNFWRLPLGTWPRYVLPLSSMGCAQMACVDKESRMFLDVAVEQGDMYGLIRLDWTFEEWIERWLNDESTTW
jgi:hypothetical protein